VSWNVIFRFQNVRVVIPDETTLLAGLPQKGDHIWTTPGFMETGESDDWEKSISWKVKDVDIFLESRKATALITLVPYAEPPPA
jgi:hypothetical protein